MKKLIMAICVCLAMVMVVSTAFAEQLWDFHLRGVDEGLAAGALPPPGLYFVNNMYFVPNYKAYNNAAESNSGVKLAGYVDVPILLWTPGCQFLGATFGMAVAEPFDFTALRVANGDGTATTGDQWGAYNTVLVPFILSWEIPCNLHVAFSTAFGLDDASNSPGHPPGNNPANAYAEAGNSSWQFTPTVGVSWLYAGWNVSAELMYTFYTESDTGIAGLKYQNGDEFAADYTLTYTCGKWTFGLGAEQQNQVFLDKAGGVKVLNSCNVNYTAGPIIGYNFGPCDLEFMYNWPLETKNDVGGEWCNLRLIIPLGNPCSWWK